MKELLETIESFLQILVEENPQKLMGSISLEKQLINQIIEAMGKEIRTDQKGNMLSPHIFSLNVAHAFYEDIKSNQVFLDDLAANLMDASQSSGINFDGSINITVFPDTDMKDGQFKIRAIWREDNLAETLAFDSEKSDLPISFHQVEAFLIVGGTQIFTLDEEIVNIGRNLDNDLVLEDPRVSRKHSQIRTVKGRHMLFDLGSSGGTFVNNKRIKQIALHPGDVLSLAGVPLVYGQETLSNLDETKEYIPPPDLKKESTSTTSIHPSDNSGITKDN